MSKFKDIETSTKIKIALMMNPHVGGLEIGVECINGIIFLTGAVQCTGHKHLAEEIARTHGGIDVKNDLVVLGVCSQPQRIKPVDPEEDYLLKKHVIGDISSDNWINALTLNIDAANGVIYLSGYQEDSISRLRAEEIARSIPGVVEVVNNIEIRRAA